MILLSLLKITQIALPTTRYSLQWQGNFQNIFYDFLVMLAAFAVTHTTEYPELSLLFGILCTYMGWRQHLVSSSGGGSG